MEIISNFQWESNKFEILQTLHTSLGHEIEESRNQMTRLIVSIAGFAVILATVILQSEIELNIKEQILITFGVLIFFTIMTIMIHTMETNFSELASVQKKIEILWGLHSKNIFSEESLMLEKWLKYGRKKWREPIFINAKLMVYLLVLFLIGIIWFK